MARPASPLHRDDPSKTPLTGHVKVTRTDWLNVARHTLITKGVAEVKILSLAAHLGVSRSSFYWYFQSRADLLSALQEEWQRRNTTTIVAHCGMDATSIGGAVCNFFRCFIDPALFDPGLDFAVREWSRRDAALRARIDAADQDRLRAITAMFERFGFAPDDAGTRARILYFMQLGYHALEQDETLEERIARVPGYVEGFTGRPADPADVAALEVHARSKRAEASSI